MANKPFDREIINVRERPFSSDINLSGYYADLSLRETIKNLITPRTSVSNADPNVSTTAKFLGTSFKVVPTSPTSNSVLITKGIGFVGSSIAEININDILGLNDTSELKPLVLSENKIVLIPPLSDPLLSRIDIIEIRSEYLMTDTQSRDIFNTVTGTFNSQNKAKTFTWSLDQSLGYSTTPSNSTTAIGYKQGTPIIEALVSPEIPPTTDGYTKIAEILVTGSSSTLSSSDMVDRRNLIFPYGSATITGQIHLPGLSDREETNLEVLKPSLIKLNAPPGIFVSCRVVSAIIDPNDPIVLYPGVVGEKILDNSKKTYEVCIFSLFESGYFEASLVGNYENEIIGSPLPGFSDLLNQQLTVSSSFGVPLLLGQSDRDNYFLNGSPSVDLNKLQPCIKFRFTCQQYPYKTTKSTYSPPSVTEPGIVVFTVNLK